MDEPVERRRSGKKEARRKHSSYGSSVRMEIGLNDRLYQTPKMLGYLPDIKDLWAAGRYLREEASFESRGTNITNTPVENTAWGNPEKTH